MFRKILFSIFLFFSIIYSSHAENKTLKDVENYLNNLKYFKSNFIQDDMATSKLSEGVFYLSRPGKLRLDYINPFEASLYTYNRTTTYYDKELDEVNNIRTASTPLQFLLRKNISFNSGDFKVVNFEENNDEIRVSFEEKTKENQGILTLNFKKNPIVLTSIKLLNELNQEIEITLFDISNEKIEDSVFVFSKSKNKKL